MILILNRCYEWNTLVRLLYLVLLYGGIVFVAHGADLHALVPLPVPLGEELHHDAVRPLSVQLKRLGGVTQICTVHHVLKNLRWQMNMVWLSDKEVLLQKI